MKARSPSVARFNRFRSKIVGCLAGLLIWYALPLLLMAARGELELSVIDADTREPVAVQVQLLNQRGRSVRPAGLLVDGDWLVFDGRTVLKLPPGNYSFRMRRGLEYRERTGNFVLKSAAADNREVELPRFVRMSKEGWWSGDLQVQPNNIAGLATRMLASDLHVVPLTFVDNRGTLPLPANAQESLAKLVGRQRTLQLFAACDRRQGSVAILISPEMPAALPAPSQTLPTPFDVARQLPTQSTTSALPFVHLAHVTCWDMPTWVALGLVDTVGILHDGLRAASSHDAPQDRPRDPLLFPEPEGVGRWSQQTYFRLLESGVRLPPAAGSGADRSGNAMGYSRVYVHCGERFTPNSWWEGLRAGRVVVTNGPLLRPRVNGELPGHVFPGTPGQNVQLEVQLQLSTQEKIRYLEIIQNGRPVQQIRLEEWVAKRGRLPPVLFQQSGWMLVRAVAEHPSGFRAAVSGPFYVEYSGQPRISRRAAQYFLDWVYQRARQVKRNDLETSQELLLEHRRARDFWQARIEQATAD